jgi:drug/metabolite transporter (DMT)-like permease
MAMSGFLFMFGNAMVKHLAMSGIPPVEIVFFRSAFSLVVLSPFVLRSPGVLRTARLKLHIGRGVVQAFSMICFFSGIGYVTLVEANALEFTAPIFATALAILFFGDKIRARRVIAMAVGFLGAIIALRPGFATLNEGHGLLLIASISWAGVLLMIRTMSKTESALTQSLYIGIVLTPIAAALAIPVWVQPDWPQLGFLFAIGATATTGQFLFAQSFRYAEMSAVLPLDFTKLIWSTIIGYVAFSFVPDIFTLLGATIIFSAGAYITIREAQLQRQAAKMA